MRTLFLSFSFTLCALFSFAQEFTLEVSAPQVVAVGEGFRVEFTMNAKPDNFVAPSFEGFELLAGPSTSQSSQMSFVNGKSSQSVSFTYSYVLAAMEEGNKTIAPASATLDKKTVKSKALPIEIVKETSSASSSSTGRTSSQQRGATLAEDDIVLVLELSNKNPYKGEAVLAQIKLLTRTNIVGLEGIKTPSFAGFWQQTLDSQSQHIEWTRETYKDKIYEVGVVQEIMLFPQQDGTIKIDPVTLNLVVRLSDPSARSNSPFDSFFGGTSGYRDVRKIVKSPEINLNIKPYPSAAPSSFKGAVGEFKLSGVLSNDMISANSSANISVKIKGSGNINLISEPTFNHPNTFELYKVTADEKIRVNTQGVSGEKTFTYPFIARAMGEFDLNPIEFTYFSPRNARFITLKTDPFAITVSADNSSTGSSQTEAVITGVSREELKILGSDIHYIMTKEPKLHKTNSMLVNSSLFFILLVLFIILGIVTVLVMQKKRKLAGDTVRVKSKKANKVALARLRESKTYLTEQNKTMFYESTLKAMWGYASDKLNIDNAYLSREGVAVKLLEKGVSEEDKDLFVSIIAQCEEARYAPSSATAISELYASAMEVITRFEQKI